jgi:hypothetical protein
VNAFDVVTAASPQRDRVMFSRFGVVVGCWLIRRRTANLAETGLAETVILRRLLPVRSADRTLAQTMSNDAH